MLSLFGVHIHDLTSKQLFDTLKSWLNSQTGHSIFTPNPEFLLSARKDLDFRQLLNKSDLSLPDGVGVKFGVAALTDHRLINRQTGIDTLELLAQLCHQEHKRLLLFGGRQDVAREAAHRLHKKYHGLDVIALDPGFVSGDHHQVDLKPSVIQEILQLNPDVIAVALGQGKQERCCINLLSVVKSTKIAIGVGGSLDTLSGRLKRAPAWMRRYGLEWLWRVLIEPKRFRRIFNASIIFPLIVIWDTLKLRRFWKAFAAVAQELIRL